MSDERYDIINGPNHVHTDLTDGTCSRCGEPLSGGPGLDCISDEMPRIAALEKELADHRQESDKALAAAHEDLDPCYASLKQLIDEREQLKETIERARTYKGIEIYACPLCTFENGRFIARCEMHRQIMVLEKELKNVRAEVESLTAWKRLPAAQRQSNPHPRPEGGEG